MPKCIGRFEIQAEIGRGGFGNVFRAFDPVMSRTVAIRTLSPEIEDFTPFLDRVVAARKLHHPHIVKILEDDRDGQVTYIVMELLDGNDLGSAIRTNRELSLNQKLRIMDDVADALSFAHDRGVLHLAVKPANIFLLLHGLQ